MIPIKPSGPARLISIGSTEPFLIIPEVLITHVISKTQPFHLRSYSLVSFPSEYSFKFVAVNIDFVSPSIVVVPYSPNTTLLHPSFMAGIFFTSAIEEFEAADGQLSAR